MARSRRLFYGGQQIKPEAALLAGFDDMLLRVGFIAFGLDDQVIRPGGQPVESQISIGAIIFAGCFPLMPMGIEILILDGIQASINAGALEGHAFQGDPVVLRAKLPGRHAGPAIFLRHGAGNIAGYRPVRRENEIEGRGAIALDGDRYPLFLRFDAMCVYSGRIITGSKRSQTDTDRNFLFVREDSTKCNS
jgi:hypothetical protein